MYLTVGLEYDVPFKARDQYSYDETVKKFIPEFVHKTNEGLSRKLNSVFHLWDPESEKTVFRTSVCFYTKTEVESQKIVPYNNIPPLRNLDMDGMTVVSIDTMSMDCQKTVWYILLCRYKSGHVMHFPIGETWMEIPPSINKVTSKPYRKHRRSTTCFGGTEEYNNILKQIM